MLKALWVVVRCSVPKSQCSKFEVQCALFEIQRPWCNADQWSMFTMEVHRSTLNFHGADTHFRSAAAGGPLIYSTCVSPCTPVLFPVGSSVLNCWLPGWRPLVFWPPTTPSPLPPPLMMGWRGAPDGATSSRSYRTYWRSIAPGASLISW